ncbi:MAG: hypothetical protein SGJ20_05600 [Planctomycetota bacterium]|nr:hypothetical protein [Planctomycetota bacterium]
MHRHKKLRAWPVTRQSKQSVLTIAAIFAASLLAASSYSGFADEPASEKQPIAIERGVTTAQKSLAANAKKGTKKPRPEKVLVTIGKDTTVVTEPLLPSGYPDYLGAMNKEFSKGVTPQNNAAVVLLNVVGPRNVFGIGETDGKLAKEGYRLLGVDPLPEKGEYLQLWEEYYESIPIEKLLELIKQDPDRPILEDGKLPDEESLRIHWRDLLLEEAMEKPWVTKDNPHMAAWLKAQGPALAKLDQLAGRTKFFTPTVTDRPGESLIHTLLPFIEPFARTVPKILIARGQLAVGEGRLDDAINDLKSMRRIASYYKDPATLVEWLVGLSSDGMSLPAFNSVVFHPKATKEQLRQLREFYRQHPMATSPMRSIDIGERYTGLSAICAVAYNGSWAVVGDLAALSGGDEDKDEIATDEERAQMQVGYRTRRFLFDFDMVLKLANKQYDRMMEIQRIPDYETRKAAWDQFDNDVKSESAEYSAIVANKPKLFLTLLTEKGRSRMMSRIVHGLFLPAIGAADNAGIRFQIYSDLRELSIALALYQKDLGKYPEKLAQLVPKYIKEIPSDRFSGKPLVYRTKGDGVLLYSVGRDKKDSDGYEGTVNEETEDADDIAVFTPHLRPTAPVEWSR